MEAETLIKESAMVDVVFDLSATSVPQNYPFALWSEISRLLPWLKEVENVGILPLRGSASGEHTLLSRRSKLVLRMPAERAADTVELSGQQLHIDGSILEVGKGKERQLQPATTLHAYMVESKLEEVEFLADMKKSCKT